MPFKTKGLHPTNDVDALRAQLFDLTQRSLLERDIRTNQLTPALLTKMPVVSPDGNSMFMEIRDDVKWDDGTPFTVDDAIFSMKILVCPLVNNPSYKPTFVPIFNNIQKDSLNPKAFWFYTNGFNRANLEIFVEIFMLQKSKWDPSNVTDAFTMRDFLLPNFTGNAQLVKWAETFNNKEHSTQLKSLEGLGPYKITKWEADSYMILEKKNNWWAKTDTAWLNQASPQKIIFKVIMDEPSLFYAIRNNQLDVTNKITTTRLLKLQKHTYFNKNYFSRFTDQYAYTYICLNQKPDGHKHKPFFTTKEVRRAMAHLVPVDDIIKIFSKGQATRMTTCIYPSKKGYDPNLKPIPFDINKAIALLESQGWRDTDGDNIRDKTIGGEKVKFSFTLTFPDIVPGNKEICLLIKDCMYKAGVEMNLAPRDFAQFYQDCYNQDFDASLGAWLGSSAHEDFSQLFSTQSWSMHGENFGGFGTAKTDNLIANINKTTSDTAYINLIHQFQEILYNEQPYVFLMSPKNKVIISNRFKNPHAYPEKPNYLLNVLSLGKNPGSTSKPTAL
ncbi:MAG TPA: ABC transporter substrate-binding protein [Flavobacteriales bacterium]|nr:ABC transporter substrate-binding protein [Flavobacteriales bacterium]